MSGTISLSVVVPHGGECREYALDAEQQDTGDGLKRRIQKVCGLDPDDQELFFANLESKQRWLNEDQTLAQQDVRDGAAVMVGVHGAAGGLPVDDGEVPSTAVDNSLYNKGDTSYYFAHARASDIPEEHRIVCGGEPHKIYESSAPVADVSCRLVDMDDKVEPARFERRIMNYSWGDESDVVKVYIFKESEADAVAAACDGKSGQIEVDWKARSLKLAIHASDKDHVLVFDRLYYDIVPEKCKWRVSANKRVTLSLQKAEATMWLKLLKPDL